ncbi:hypothetical protein K469DRAFT_585737 [Zopfia rhizophila CBS 207.26]|uniref:Uncharacterized protein n=1 Tax=Zopfia rhizophila CBS 207.26 TaxID=1314779 RepID=A0A6A6DW81_9PEZI|nr:hypothetical protein K469DRAFT_585737 [Zopfia rhizophila CBS 207.26]
MPEPHLFKQRKRQRPEQRPSQPNETSQPVSKKQKVGHPSGLQPPAAFWDNLSKIWLTKRALRELDRRNTQPAPNPPHSSYRRLHRPVTRRALAELKKSWHPIQPATDFLSHCTSKRLEDIKLFARHGGPDLSDLKGCRKHASPLYCTMSSSQSSSRGRKRCSTTTLSTKPTTNTTNTKTTGTYDRDFLQHLIDNDVYPDEYEYPDGSVPAEPNKWEEINQILSQPRPSLSPSQFSDGEFRKFKRADAHAPKEKQVSESVIPIIEGRIEDGKCRSGGIPFTNLDPLTDGTLKPGNPDIYYGARPEQLDRQVRDKLSGQIIPSTQHDLPIAPNFFLAAKGPDGSLAVAGRQACYDGALGARGMHSLRSYGEDEPVYDNNAYTITSIYHGGQLKMYTSHLTQPSSPGGSPEYHMTQINTWGMTGNADTFRQGARAYRNARDWAKELRDGAISQANERANHVQARVPAVDASGVSLAPSFVTDASEEPYTIEPLSEESRTSVNEGSNTTADSQESETSTDELALDYRLPAKRSSGHTRQSHQAQRKRRNAGESSNARHSHRSTVTSASQGFSGKRRDNSAERRVVMDE